MTGSSPSPVLHLAEIVLWVRDMNRALDFYRDLFGLSVISPPELPNKFLLAGPGEGPVPEMIVLVPHPDPLVAFPKEKPLRPLHHMAFNVSAEQYDALAERCRATGLEVRGGIHPVLKGVRTFYVDDPDGNEVEVIAPA
ncbi:MAG TPA: VOC family protein [Candidatus Dormibacteraeota bacterium]|nr:VOC family protein [Candidatus Dormibacteraeota bacterium]